MLSTGISALQKILFSFFFIRQYVSQWEKHICIYVEMSFFNSKSKGCEMSSWCDTPEVKQIIEVIFITFLEDKLNLSITWFLLQHCSTESCLYTFMHLSCSVIHVVGFGTYSTGLLSCWGKAHGGF